MEPTLLQSFADCNWIISKIPAMQLSRNCFYSEAKGKLQDRTVVIQEMIDKELEILNILRISVCNNQLLSDADNQMFQQYVTEFLKWKKNRSLDTYCNDIYKLDLSYRRDPKYKIVFYAIVLISTSSMFKMIAHYGWDSGCVVPCYSLMWSILLICFVNVFQELFLTLEILNITHRYNRHCNSQLSGLFNNMLKSTNYLATLSSYGSGEMFHKSSKFLSNIFANMGKIHTRNIMIHYTSAQLKHFLKLCDNCTQALTDNNLSISLKELDLFVQTSQKQNDRCKDRLEWFYGANAKKVLPASASIIEYMGIATVGLMVLSACYFICQCIMDIDYWDVHIYIASIMLFCLLVSVKKHSDIKDDFKCIGILEQSSQQRDRGRAFLRGGSSFVGGLDMLYIGDSEFTTYREKV